MIILTEEQAQQIEEALDELRYANNTDIAKTKYYKALSTIRAARAQADHIVDADKMVREQVLNYERLNALREGEQNKAEDDYFNARPENDTPTLRKMFCQGFERGFHKGIKYAATAEPMKQEPVAWTYEEVKSAFEYLKLQVKGPDDKWTVGESCTYFGFFRHGIDAATQRRTAPVHTKDLTAVEILAVARGIGVVFDESDKEQQIDDIQVFARAVIAADREKNRG